MMPRDLTTHPQPASMLVVALLPPSKLSEMEEAAKA
jgi:hypothetical protein